MKKYLLFLCLCANVLSVSAQHKLPPVRFEHGDEFFSAPFDANENAAAPGEIIDGYYARYVQFDAIPPPDLRARAETLGVQWLGYLAENAYLVALPESLDLEKLRPLGVRAIVAPQPAWKMSQALREPPFGDWARHGDWLDVQLQVWPWLTIEKGAGLCRQNGLRVLREGRQNGWLLVQIPAGRAATVAGWPFVRRLELAPPPGEPDDNRGRAMHRANLLDSAPTTGPHFDGTGVKLLLRDDGRVGPHIDFQGRLHNLTPDDDPDQHADGVAGIFSGAGNRDPLQRGMATGADLFVLNYVADFQDETLPLHLEQNVTITNTSYSENCNEGYNLNAQTVDQQLYEHPTLMHVFSAGNRGANDCGYGAGPGWGNVTGGHKIAKNGLVVANLRVDGSLDGTSSRGPASDGRLKPDLSAFGTGQVSTGPGHNYFTFGGTSAAAPGVAGILAQLTHAWKNEHNDQDPPAALLKAALLNTATDLGQPGPDFLFGWGQVHAWRAWELLHQNRFFSGAIQANDPDQTLLLDVPAGTREVKIMLLWADPPALPGAAKALVNDLDLEVESLAGSLYLPLRPNPTPDPAVLNGPATPGRDSLNNVEQVVLTTPEPGPYRIKVRPASVPMDMQPYWLAWQLTDDAVQLCYPAGGEGFVPGETERIHWDAFGAPPDGHFTLEWFDGQNWTVLATLGPAARFYDWQIPTGLSAGQARLRISRGAAMSESGPFSVVGVPAGLDILRVCPDSLTIAWQAVGDTLAYDVYSLGEKRMEIVGTTAATAFTLPIVNALAEQWVSVGASAENGSWAGRRAKAVFWPGELKECPQTQDLGVRAWLSPDPAGVLTCSPVETIATVYIRNEGLAPVDGAWLNLQVNGQAPIAESLAALAPGESVEHSFQTPLLLTANDTLRLTCWLSFPADGFKANDTLRVSVPVVVEPAADFFVETFEPPSFPPSGWAVENPDQAKTWRRSLPVAGPDGLPTRSVWLNCYQYETAGQQDGLRLTPIQLPAMPALYFDLAHARFNSNTERLRVEVLADCDPAAPPVIVWDQSDPELGTATPTTGEFIPNEPGDWRAEMVDLAAFAGQTVLIRFVATNGYGNNLYLDNVGIVSNDLSEPEALPIASADSLCAGGSLSFSAAPAGSPTIYQWDFGATAQPAEASGPGPHWVTYAAAGMPAVRLIVANLLGADTAFYPLSVQDAPQADFSTTTDGLSAVFQNLGLPADQYEWDFGDGAGSTEFSPEHTYAGGGTYVVRLVATNACGADTLTAPLSLSVGVDALQFVENVRIMPNPNRGEFRIALGAAAAGEVSLSLADWAGRVLAVKTLAVAPGRNVVAWAGLNLPAGIYRLHVGGRVWPVVIL